MLTNLLKNGATNFGVDSFPLDVTLWGNDVDVAPGVDLMRGAAEGNRRQAE